MINLLENTRRHDITFFRNGRIIICARIVRALGLSPGDTINVALKDNEYLLYAVHNIIGRHQARCYPTKRGSHNFCANSIKLCRSLLDSCGISSSRASFMAGEPIILQSKKYIPIITAHPLGFCFAGV